MCLKHLFLFIQLLVVLKISAVVDNPAFLPLPKGLTSNSVSAIVQDKQGFMWIGTLTGLNMYDGYTYKTYDFNLLQKNTITNSRITDLKVTDDGNLWIGTYGGGINIYNSTYRTFEHIYLGKGQNDLLSNNVLKLLVKSDGTIYAATESGIFAVYPNNRYHVKPIVPEAFRNLTINCLTEDFDENIWVGTQNKGLFKIFFNDSVATGAKSVSLEGQSKNIRSIGTDNNGNIWLTYRENGFSHLIIEKGEIKTFVHSNLESRFKAIDNMPVQTVFCNINGEVWMGTENAGLVVVEAANYSYRRFLHNDKENLSLPDNSVWTICRDNSGIIWLGTYSHGLCRIDPFWNKFDQYTNEINYLNTEFYSTIVTSFCLTDNQKLIIATDGAGMYTYEREKLIHIPSAPNLLDVSQIDDSYWVSSWNGGIDIYSKSFKLINHLLDKLPVFKIIRDNLGFYWAVTWGKGIFLFDKNYTLVYNFTATDTKFPIASSNIFTIYEDSENRIWVGTLNGLSLVTRNSNGDFNIDDFTSIPDDSTTLSSNIVLSINQDSEQNIWIGTSNGLNKFLPGGNNFERIVNFQAGNSFEVRSIIEAENQNLWLGTNKGLIKFNPYSKKARIYNESDGLPFLEFRVNSAARISSDKIFFGGNGGVVLFNPQRIEDNPKAPNTVITDLKIFNIPIEIGEKSVLKKSISETNTIVLSHKMNVFTFEFTAINYTRPEKNSFEYILEGLETSWNNVGNQRNATYSNLDAGEYTFKVRSANNDGIWDETPCSIKIIVEPPFYKTWLFKIIVFCFIGFIIYLIISFRMNELKRSAAFSENLARLEKWKRMQVEYEQQKENLGMQLDERTHELGEVNLQIAQKNEKLFAVHQQILDILPNASRENYKKLVQLRRSLEEDINQKDNWKALETGVNLTHDNFLHRFTEKFPKITHKDLKLVAYIRMNLSNKEIANLLNITLRSVESGRYRLRKRLDIHSDTNLNDFIMRY